MKSLNELLAGVRDCEEQSLDFHIEFKDEDGFDCSPGPAQSFQAGHRAACEKLIPALEEALSALETHCTGFAGCDAHRSIEKIRAILGGEK